MATDQQTALSQLLAAWRRREEARDRGDFRELFEARARLDAARLASRTAANDFR